MHTSSGFPNESVLKSLQDPARRQLYVYVCGCAEPVTREDASQAVGISRTLAAYHLDHLAASGLLHVSYARPEGKSGPGAGRPAKMYEAVQQEILLSLPTRNYRLLATLLAAAVEADTTGAVGESLKHVAKIEGQKIGSETDCFTTALQELGYKPQRDAQDVISMLNCPFHTVAQQQTELVCQMNQQFIEGVLEGSGDQEHCAQLRPQHDRCCVQIIGRE